MRSGAACPDMLWAWPRDAVDIAQTARTEPGAVPDPAVLRSNLLSLVRP